MKGMSRNYITIFADGASSGNPGKRSEEHTSELQSRSDLVCRLLLEKKNSSALRVFLTDYLPRQRPLSPRTLNSYRDSLKLLLLFVAGLEVGLRRLEIVVRTEYPHIH